MSGEVTVTRDGAVQVVTINRPQTKNALNRAVAEGIRAAIDDADADDAVRACVLTGSGGEFSSGADLQAFLHGETAELADGGLCGIAERPACKPLIGAVEGWALAAGLELLLACDIVIAGSEARLGLPEVQRGLVAGGGGALLLPRKIAPAVAMELLLTGDPIGAERAAAIGLVNEVVPAGGALSRAIELGRRIALNGPLAVQVTKAIARRSADWDSTEMWSRQRTLTEPVLASDDAHEGARAFAERRAPRWTAS